MLKQGEDGGVGGTLSAGGSSHIHSHKARKIAKRGGHFYQSCKLLGKLAG